MEDANNAAKEALLRFAELPGSKFVNRTDTFELAFFAGLAYEQERVAALQRQLTPTQGVSE